jgi:hypothetical protein
MNQAVLDRVREISEKYLKNSQSSNDRNLGETRDRIRAALEKTLKTLNPLKIMTRSKNDQVGWVERSVTMLSGVPGCVNAPVFERATSRSPLRAFCVLCVLCGQFPILNLPILSYDR